MTHTLSFFCFMWTRVVRVCSFRKASVWFDPIAERILDWSEGKNSSGKNRRTRGEWKQEERPMNDKMLHRREIPIEQRNYSCSGTKVRRRETVCCSVGPRNNEPLSPLYLASRPFFPFNRWFGNLTRCSVQIPTNWLAKVSFKGEKRRRGTKAIACGLGQKERNVGLVLFIVQEWSREESEIIANGVSWPLNYDWTIVPTCLCLMFK